MNDIPWNDIDSEILPVVKILNDHGIETFACCSGHEKEDPWVNCAISKNYGEEDIIAVLLSHNYCGFGLSNTRYVNRASDPFREGNQYHFWTIRFWSPQSSGETAK